MGERLGALPLPLLLMVLGGLAVSYLMRAVRLYGEFSDVAHGQFAAMVRIALTHNAMVNLVPLRGGEVALPMLLHRQFAVPVQRAIISLLWLRLQDAFVVLVIAAWLWPQLPLALRLAWTLVVVVAAIAIPAWARAHPLASAQERRDGWRQMLARLRVTLAHSTRGGGSAWAWTVGNWLVKLIAQSLLLAALLDASLGIAGAGVLGAELAAMLPLQGVASIGTYEAGVAIALAPLGILPSAALQAALALHLVIIGAAVAAGAVGMAVLPAGRRIQTESNEA